MATKKKDKAAEADAAVKEETKKGGKKELTAEEKKAKRKAMKERLKNRAPGQRPNSKQCDIIDLGDGNVAKTFAMNVRKYGVFITSVVIDKDGKVVAVSNATIPGVSVKSKKEHGTLVPKMPGMGKKGKAADAEGDEEDEEDEDDEE